jgi:hypothetical protein
MFTKWWTKTGGHKHGVPLRTRLTCHRRKPGQNREHFEPQVLPGLSLLVLDKTEKLWIKLDFQAQSLGSFNLSRKSLSICSNKRNLCGDHESLGISFINFSGGWFRTSFSQAKGRLWDLQASLSTKSWFDPMQRTWDVKGVTGRRVDMASIFNRVHNDRPRSQIGGDFDQQNWTFLSHKMGIQT